MSGFAVIYERSNTPVDPGVLECVMKRLSHRGPDGSDLKMDGHVAMGHWHFWTTPEEVNEKQPLEVQGLPFTIVLDGRLDNRAEIISDLGLKIANDQVISDAALILQAYDRWGEKCLEHFIGQYALVIHDNVHQKLFCARDALGERTMFYSLKGTRLVIASEPWAAAGAANSPAALDERVAAHFFALKSTGDGQSFFKDIFELLPAHAMTFSGSGLRTWCYWQPDTTGYIRGRSDMEYAEEFRALLEESVRCRMRSTSPVGVLMSGGLDSTSVACLAARSIAPAQLTTISYVFDELPDCDERKYINMVGDRWQTRSIHIPCEDAWPWRDWQNWPVNPNQPEGNPYRLLKERAYDRANEEGLRVLLTGGYGDHLYTAGREWLADMLSEGRLREAGKELSLYTRYEGPGWTVRSEFFKRAMRRLLDALPGGKALHRRPHAAPWLTSFSAAQLTTAGNAPPPALARHGVLLEVETAADAAAEIGNASRHRLELRHPYRDRRLVEFVLKLPGYQLFYRGLYKHILRNAMQGILPDGVRTRPQQTSLVSLYSRGIDRERALLRTVFMDEDAVWRKYVNPQWVENRWDAPVTVETDGPQALVNWMCTSFTRWYNNNAYFKRSEICN